MEKVSGNVFAETKIRGCNPGYVVTSDGVVVIDAPQLPTHAVKMRKEVESHGPVCTKTYIPIQSAFIREWVTAVAVGIARGWSKEECVKRISFLDRFPVDIGQEYMEPRVQELNVMALYDYLTRDR